MKFSIKQFIYNLDLPLDIVKEILLYLSPCDFKMRQLSLEYKNMRMSKKKKQKIYILIVLFIVLFMNI